MKSEVSNSGWLKVSREWFLSCSVILDNMDGPRWMLELLGCREEERVKREASKTLAGNCP